MCKLSIENTVVRHWIRSVSIGVMPNHPGFYVGDPLSLLSRRMVATGRIGCEHRCPALCAGHVGPHVRGKYSPANHFGLSSRRSGFESPTVHAIPSPACEHPLCRSGPPGILHRRFRLRTPRIHSPGCRTATLSSPAPASHVHAAEYPDSWSRNSRAMRRR